MVSKIYHVQAFKYINGIFIFKKNSLSALKYFKESYGDLPYFGWPLKTVMLFHPDDIKKVLVDEKHNNQKGDQAKLLRFTLGTSLFILEGEEWRQRKSIIQKVFHHHAILGYVPTIENTTLKYIEKWKKNHKVNLSEEIMALNFQISSQIFFGGVPEEKSEEIRHAFYMMGKIIAKKFSSPIKLPFWIPTRNNLELKKQLKILDNFIFDLIRKKRAEKGANSESFLERLIDSEVKLTDREIRNEVVTFMGAGYETTATFITWTLYLLMKHPEYINNFKKADKLSSERKNIMQEALRLYPSFPINARQNITSINLGGVDLPPKTNFLISPFIIQRDPRFWQNPEEFQPERFINMTIEELKYKFIPFMVGPKKCIGEQLAYQEAEVIIEAILNHTTLELLTHELNPICDILLYSDVPLICNIK